MPAVSIILTTYNKPRDLARALEGVRHQEVRDLELLVCDDGSGPETAAVVEGFAQDAGFPVHHVWQEDAGFRAARSRNNGARRASGDVLVFLDGDCVALPDFVGAHLAAQRAGWFLAGERYMLEQEEAEAVSLEAVRSGRAFAEVPPRELKRVRGVRRKDSFYRLVGLKPHRPRLMTSNCSMARATFEQVNGLDERYEGWGQEDEDLRRRLLRRGLRIGSVVGDANCLHLWHPADDSFLGTRRRSPNWRYYERGFQLSRCRRGLVERPLAEVTARVVGGDVGALAALGLRAPSAGEVLEVEVLLDDGSGPAPRASGEAEVTLCVAARPDPARARGVDVLFGAGLETAGGDLPGEQLPEVAEAFRAAGVKALRPLPSPDLGPGAFAVVRDALERIL